MNINLEYYKVFYTVAKSGSISGAAGELFISQPAVSQAVKHLEELLGVNLFLRTSKGVRLTKEGELLYSYVGQGYEYFLRAEEVFAQIQELESGEIRIGASDMTLRFYLLPFLERFHSLYPKVKISVTNGPTPETVSFLQEGKIDFGLVSAPVETKGRMRLWEVGEIQDVFVAAEKFHHLQGRPIPPGELAALPLILLEKNTSTRRSVDGWFSQNGATARPEFELATSELIVQFAARGLGVGCVVESFATPALEKGELFALQPSIPLPPRSICLIAPTKGAVSPACQRLLEMLLPPGSLNQ